MRKNRIAVYVLTALLTLVAAAIVYYQEQWEDFPLTVIVESEAGREKIQSWKKIPDTFYIFLPGYADPEGAKIQTNWVHPIAIEGERVGKDASCADYPFNVPLRMTYSNRGKTIEQTLIFTQSGGVATLYLDTASGSMDYINQSRDYSEGANLRLYTLEGMLDCAAGVQEIACRGNSTWEAEKKPYRLKLAVQRNLLGMGAAEDWILLANDFDSSHIRNKASYDFARSIQTAFSPEAQWVDLYANGAYLGLYLLTERNQIHPQRLAIPEEESFLVSMEWPARTQWEQLPNVLSDRGNLLMIRHNGLGQERLRQVWQSAENAIYASDGIDPVTGKHWRELIDVDSWAEQYLLREVFADGDACAMSQFFYYTQSDGKLYAGPLWDMDNTLNCWKTQIPNVLTAARRYVWNGEQEALFYTLCRKEEFRDRVLGIYYERFRPGLTALSSEGFARYAEIVSPAAAMNAVRWDRTWRRDCAQELGTFLEERMEFLEGYWASPEDYCLIVEAGEVQWRSYAFRRGEPATALGQIPNAGWFVYETGEPFDITGPVTEDWVIYQTE